MRSRKKPKLFAVTGISGSGKTSVARELIKRGYQAFDSKTQPGIFQFKDASGNTPHRHELSNPQWLRKYKWQLNEPLLHHLISTHNNESVLFLCGRGNIRKHLKLFEKIYLLEINEHVLIERLNNPSRDNWFAKDTATQQRLARELAAIQSSLLHAGAIPIDATQTLELVVDEVIGNSLQSD